MMHRRISVVVCLLALATLATPISVSFGTTHDSRPLPRSALDQEVVASAPPSHRAAVPAPVSEETADVPNPATYRPLLPHQYRTRLYALKPPADLLLGTPLDRRYTPSVHKYDVYEKQQRTGAGYTGPHVFDRQDYELQDDAKARKVAKTRLQSSVAYQRGYVPQIGVVFSSGVRYYVPQIFYYRNEAAKDDEGLESMENEVYDRNDVKHFYRGNQ